jgi:hypothetical protein
MEALRPLDPRGGQPWGMMQSRLSVKEWQRAAKGTLIFTPEQAEQIKARVLRQS